MRKYPSAAGIIMKNGDIAIAEGHAMSHDRICDLAGLDINNELYRLQIYDQGIFVELWFENIDTVQEALDIISERYGKDIEEIREEVKGITSRFINYPVKIRIWSDGLILTDY